MSATRDEVTAAFDAYEGLWAFILERIRANRAHMPRTALATHGGVGLNKAGALDNRMQSFIAQEMADGHEYTFWLPVDQR